VIDICVVCSWHGNVDMHHLSGCGYTGKKRVPRHDLTIPVCKPHHRVLSRMQVRRRQAELPVGEEMIAAWFDAAFLAALVSVDNSDAVNMSDRFIPALEVWHDLLTGVWNPVAMRPNTNDDPRIEPYGIECSAGEHRMPVLLGALTVILSMWGE
jgi:hypothetical protein